MKTIIRRVITTLDIIAVLFYIWVICSTVNIYRNNSLETTQENIWKYNAYVVLLNFGEQVHR